MWANKHSTLWIFALGVAVCIAAAMLPTPVFGGDEPKPNVAIVRMLDAIHKEDKEALAACFVVASGNAEEAAWLKVGVDDMVASQRLDRVSVAKFGRPFPLSAGASPHFFVSDVALKEHSAAIEATPALADNADPGLVHVTIDAAQFKMQPTTRPSTRPSATEKFALRKVGAEWKIDVDSDFHPNKSAGDSAMTPERRREEQQLFRDLYMRTVKAKEEVADEIEAGRYRSIDEASEAPGTKADKAEVNGAPFPSR